MRIQMWYQEYIKRLAQINAVAFAIEFVIETYKIFRNRFNNEDDEDEYTDQGYDENEEFTDEADDEEYIDVEIEK